MKKTYCDQCGKEFEAFMDVPKRHGEQQKHMTEMVLRPSKYELFDIVSIGIELRHCEGSQWPPDLCKPCLLAIVTEALVPPPEMAVMHRCGKCSFEWRPLPKVTDGACPRCGSFTCEAFGRPLAECPAPGCCFPQPQEKARPREETVRCSACGKTPDCANYPDDWRWTGSQYAHLHELTGSMESEPVYQWFACS